METVVPHERKTMISRPRSCGALAAAIGVAVVLPSAAQADTGEVIDEFTDPVISKANATKEWHTCLSCSFTNRFEFFDELLDEDLVVEFTGPVTGFYTPARP